MTAELVRILLQTGMFGAVLIGAGGAYWMLRQNNRSTSGGNARSTPSGQMSTQYWMDEFAEVKQAVAVLDRAQAERFAHIQETMTNKLDRQIELLIQIRERLGKI